MYQTKMRRRTLITTVCAVLTAGCIGSGEREVEDMSAVETAAVAFEGDYSEEEIQQMMDATFDRYGVARTEENYLSTADALVAMRQENDVTEIGVLHCVYEADLVNTGMYDPGMDAVASAIALCATEMDAR